MSRWQATLLFACALGTLAPKLVDAAPRKAVGFEQRLVLRTLMQRGLLPHTNPEGKRIERIEIVSLDVFTPSDPVPDAFNALHATTREEIIRQELLFEAGQSYDRARVEESARNLRLLTILGVAIILPFRVSDSEAVGVLVITKDVWSLRMGFYDLLVLDDTIRGRGALTEMNLFGRGKRIQLSFAFDPWVREVGQAYFDRRLFGSHWVLRESLDLLMDVEAGNSLRGRYELIHPFYSLGSRWGAQLSVSHDQGVSRSQEGNGLASILLDNGQRVDYQYERDLFFLDAVAAYQLGSSYKQRLAIGLRTSSVAYRANDQVPENQSGSFFAKIRRQSEFSNRLEASWSLAGTEYRKLRGVDTYALTEDFLVGPRALARLGWSSRAFGSDADFLSGALELGYRWILAKELQLALFAEIEGRWQEGGLIDQQLGLHFRQVSPRTKVGRLIWDGDLVLRKGNAHLGIQVLGGDGALRGYPIGFLRGDNVWKSNLEWRSRSWHWMTYHVGFVVFWDVASAWDGGERPEIHHGVGVGGRLLLPQANRSVLRLDLAGPPDNLGAGRVVFSFDQAF